MRAIMVMFDSLNKSMLSPYGCDWVHTPNFLRLEKKSVKFTKNYAGSLPCIPARRELHTGRYNFLHRNWGPLEPYDDSMPQLLKENGIYSHLVSDHYHYWEDGGANYNTRYSSWEIIRGQEKDPWKYDLSPDLSEDIPEHYGQYLLQYHINRKKFISEERYPQSLTFKLGLEFMEENAANDNWFLQIETFDPHEPFDVPDRYLELYKEQYNDKFFFHPEYKCVTESDEQIRHLRIRYAALLSMCDANLGKVLDMMDSKDMWNDTMLIVCTDHGFLLGEHGWWAKNVQPFYNEIVNTPLFIWDPRSKRQCVACDELVQTIDLAPTILEYFSVSIPEDMQGKALKETLSDSKPLRDACLFGIHGGNINCTDGRYVYMRAPRTAENHPLYNYTLMPTQTAWRIDCSSLRDAEPAGPFEFTKGCRVLRIKTRGRVHPFPYTDNLLFDLESDREQSRPLCDPLVEDAMISRMIKLMKENDAPKEQYIRTGIEDYV